MRRVPGRLFGYLRSAAACVRIQDALQNLDLLIIKSHQNLSNGLFAGVVIRFFLYRFGSSSPAFSGRKIVKCGRGTNFSFNSPILFFIFNFWPGQSAALPLRLNSHFYETFRITSRLVGGTRIFVGILWISCSLYYSLWTFLKFEFENREILKFKFFDFILSS